MSTTMNMKEFSHAVVEEIKKYLPEEYQNSSVQLNIVRKNNETLDSLVISSPSATASPTIYLQSFYEDYLAGEELEQVMQHIADFRVEHEVSEDLKIDISAITDFEKSKSAIAARIIGVENNVGLLNERPHFLIEDLAVIYCIVLNQEMSVPITNDLLVRWGISPEELHDIALANQEESSFSSMHDVMLEMMDVPPEVAEMFVPADDGRMFVLTNRTKYFGASALLDQKLLEQIAEKVGEFYILPSSVHEVLIVPTSAGMTITELADMVKEVNLTELEAQDILSNSVYQYNADTNKIVKAA